MLTDVSREEFDALEWKRPKNPRSDFARDAVAEFAASGMPLAEVSGWPGGDPKDRTAAARLRGLLAQHAKQPNVKVRQRGARLFLVNDPEGGEDAERDR